MPFFRLGLFSNAHIDELAKANRRIGNREEEGRVIEISHDEDDEYRKKNGEPPEAMKTLYEILHRKHIEHAAAVKGMLALYKEI